MESKLNFLKKTQIQALNSFKSQVLLSKLFPFFSQKFLKLSKILAKTLSFLLSLGVIRAKLLDTTG